MLERAAEQQGLDYSRVIKLLLGRAYLADICRAFATEALRDKELKEDVIQVISRHHRDRPRPKSLIGAGAEKLGLVFLADMLWDNLGNMPSELALDILQYFFFTRRQPLIMKLADELGVGVEIDFDPLESEPGLVFDPHPPQINEERAKEIVAALSKKYPATDVLVLLAIALKDSPESFSPFVPIINAALSDLSEPSPEEGKGIESDIAALGEFQNLLEKNFLWLRLNLQFELKRMKKGLLPAGTLAADIESVLRAFEAMRIMLRRTPLMPFDMLDKLDSTTAVSDLREVLDEWQDILPDVQRVEKFMATAQETVDALLQLTYIGDKADVPLMKLKRDLQKAQMHLTQKTMPRHLYDSVMDFAAEKGPYRALLELVKGGENIALSRVDELKQILEPAFDEQIVLAALRGKLLLKSDAPQKPVTAPPPAQTASKPSFEAKAISLPAREKPPAIGPAPEALKKKEAPKPFISASDATVEYLALEVGTGAVEKKELVLRDLVWLLLRDGKGAEAYALACWVETSAPEIPYLLPSWLIHAMSISPFIGTLSVEDNLAYMGAIEKFKPDTLFPDNNYDWQFPVSSMLAASLLLPILVDPGLGAIETLDSLRVRSVPSFGSLCKEVREFGGKRYPLTAENIKAAKDVICWEESHRRIVEEASMWLKKVQSAGIKFVPAKLILTNWLSKNGFISRVIQPAIIDDHAAAKQARELAELMSDEHIMRQEIQVTDKKVSPGRFGGSIAGPAREQLVDIAKEASRLSLRWAKSIEAVPADKGSFASETCTALLRKFNELCPAIEEEFEERVEANGNVPAAVASRFCLDAIEQLHTFLTEGKVGNGAFPRSMGMMGGGADRSLDDILESLITTKSPES